MHYNDVTPVINVVALQKDVTFIMPLIFLKSFFSTGVDKRISISILSSTMLPLMSKLRQSFSFKSRFSTLQIERNKFDKKFFNEIFFFFINWNMLVLFVFINFYYINNFYET